MIEAVRDFLSLLDNPPEEKDARLRALAAALDRLNFFYHTTEAGELDYHNDPPSNVRESPSEFGKRFPDLGFYPVADPLGQIMDTPMMGDAIDDLLDIRAEMAEVAWRWDNNGPGDAKSYYRFSYGVHWGEHLLECRTYLHALQFR